MKGDAAAYSNNIIDITVSHAVDAFIMYLLDATYHTYSGHTLTCYISQSQTTLDAFSKGAFLFTH